MSKNKGFSETSAGRYSLALYELALESDGLLEVESQSTSILNLLKASEDFRYLVKDPTNTIEDQLKVLNELSQRYKINDLLNKFLSFLVSKRRLFYVEKILKDFIETCSKKRGEIKAELTAARQLSESEINNIKDELSKTFNSKIRLKYKNDPSLIGGLIVQVGSTMVDTSIKSKLQKIENKMIEA